MRELQILAGVQPRTLRHWVKKEADGEACRHRARGVLPRVQPNALTGEGMPGPPPATTHPFVSWEVVTLMDGLVLLVNGSKAPGLRRVVDDIYRHYAGPVSRGPAAN